MGNREPRQRRGKHDVCAPCSDGVSAKDGAHSPRRKGMEPGFIQECSDWDYGYLPRFGGGTGQSSIQLISEVAIEALSCGTTERGALLFKKTGAPLENGTEEFRALSTGSFQPGGDYFRTVLIGKCVQMFDLNETVGDPTLFHVEPVVLPGKETHGFLLPSSSAAVATRAGVTHIASSWIERALPNWFRAMAIARLFWMRAATMALSRSISATWASAFRCLAFFFFWLKEWSGTVVDRIPFAMINLPPFTCLKLIRKGPWCA